MQEEMGPFSVADPQLLHFRGFFVLDSNILYKIFKIIFCFDEYEFFRSKNESDRFNWP